MSKKVLVSLTTYRNENWRQTIADLKKFGVGEFALFMTGMGDSDERWTLYREIEKTIPNIKIPFCHIRPEMSPEELDYLSETFETELFNIHTLDERPLVHNYTPYLKRILIENSGKSNIEGLELNDVKDFGGICLDLSHLEAARLQQFPGYEFTRRTIEKIPVLANHISAICPDLREHEGHSLVPGYDWHDFTDLSQFDYLKNFPADYFGKYIALELVNPISEQLEAKRYIEGLIAQTLRN